MFKAHRKIKERVYHTEETKRRALDALRANPTRPKAAIAREFGISPGTFNMWTHEDAVPTRDGLGSLKVGDTVMASIGPKRVLSVLPGDRYILTFTGSYHAPDGLVKGWTAEEMRKFGFKVHPSYRWPEDGQNEISPTSANLADNDSLAQMVEQLRQLNLMLSSFLERRRN